MNKRDENIVGDPTVTEPSFERADYRAMDACVAGEVTESVDTGRVALADAADASLAAVRENISTVSDRLVGKEVTARS